MKAINPNFSFGNYGGFNGAGKMNAKKQNASQEVDGDFSQNYGQMPPPPPNGQNGFNSGGYNDSQNNEQIFGGNNKMPPPPPNGQNDFNGGQPPKKPDADFAGTIANYLVESQGISEEEAANLVSELGKDTVIHDPVEAVKEYFGITDEQEAKEMAEEIFGPPPAPPEMSNQQQSQKLNMMA